MSNVTWQIFTRYPQWESTVGELDVIPPHWSLTPLKEKIPIRTGWQYEATVSRDYIRGLLKNGESRISKKGNPYTAYISGIGVRTGDHSDGLLCIDFDGLSSHPIWNALKGEGEDPLTVSWTSGKNGREQRAYQMPDQHRETFKDLTRIVLNDFNGIVATDGEQLEIRYNRSESVLPPSFHPSTGSYKWINSPQDTSVAIAPDWLCNFLLDRVLSEKARKERLELEREERQKQWELFKQESIAYGDFTWKDDLDFARHLLTFIYPDVSYKEWIDIGMALNSIDDRLLHDFDLWSRRGSKYKTGECEVKWKSFKRHGIGIGTLIHYAQNGGFSFPKKEYKYTPIKLKKQRELHDDLIRKYYLKNTHHLPYKQGCIPHYDDCEGVIKLTYEYESDLKIIERELTQKGHKVLVNKSGTGSGKSHNAALIEHEGIKTFFLVNEPRNVTVKTLRNYSLMSSRHNGLTEKKGKIRRAKEGDQLIEYANCTQTEKHNQLIESNLGIGQDICKKCPDYDSCKALSGWFINERRTTLRQHKIVGHPSQLPYDADYRKYRLVFDDCLQLTKKINLELSKLTVAWHHWIYQIVEPSIKDTIQTVLSSLGRKVTDYKNKDLNYGYLLDLKEFGDIKEILTLEVLNALDSTINLQASERLTNGHSIEGSGILVPILKIATGHLKGAITIHRDSIALTFVDTELLAKVDQSWLTAILDATTDLATLEQIWGKFVVIEKVSPKTDNFTIDYIKTEGTGTNPKNWRKATRERVNAVMAILKSEYPELRFLGQKSLGLDFQFYNDHRGSNDMRGLTQLGMIGSPNGNITSFMAEYQAIFGDNEGFSHWYDYRRFNELVQAIGRQRSNRYPDLKFALYWINDDPMVNLLGEVMGIQVYERLASSVTSAGGTKGDNTRVMILLAAIDLVKANKKVGATAIARLCNITRDGVYKMLPVGDGGIEKLYSNALNIYKQNYTLLESTSESWSTIVPMLVKDFPEIAAWAGLIQPPPIETIPTQDVTAVATEVAITQTKEKTVTKEITELKTVSTTPVYEWSEVKEGLRAELKRLGWTSQDAGNYIKGNYGVGGTKEMSDTQIIEFWEYLKNCQPKAPIPA